MKNSFLYFLSAGLILALVFGCTPIDIDSNNTPPTEEVPGQGGSSGDGQTPDEGGDREDGSPDQELPDSTVIPEPVAAYYQTVTQSYDDWSGDYLLTYSTATSINVFNSWTGDDKGVSTVDLFSKLGSEGIAAEEGDPYKAVITKVGEGYSIYLTGVGYLGCESSENTVSKSSTPPEAADTKYLWELSYKNGIWVTNVSYSRRIQWNNNASIFRCYTGGQKELTLYRRTSSSSQGGTVTPDPKPDPDDPDDGGVEPKPEDPTPEPEPEDPSPDSPSDPSDSSNGYGWYELPVMNCTREGSTYLAETTSKYGKVYYAHHFCAGGEKYAHNGRTARNYTVCYSAEHHCPVWVAAIRHNGLFPSRVDRTDSYGKDPSIPSDIQYNSKSTGGGCNKGHMLGSKERTSSTATNKQVFYYTNIAPQKSGTFNTGGGGWNTLEDWVDGKVCPDTLYMVIGAYFDSYIDPRGISDSPSTISFGGRNDVSCPTMFYYALLRTKNGNTGKSLSQCNSDEIMCAAFVRSHETPMKTAVSSAEMISISELERITGFTYFPNVPQAPKGTFKASDWGL